MRTITCAAMLILIGATGALAQSPMDRFFPSRSGCYERQYSPDHLGQHPQQRVTGIRITAEADVADPMLGLWVEVKARGTPGGDFIALAYCENIDDTLYCGMEGDAGAFSIRAGKGQSLMIEVGRYGMTFENDSGFLTLEADRGDDRSFRLDPTACR